MFQTSMLLTWYLILTFQPYKTFVKICKRGMNFKKKETKIVM